MGSPDVRRDRGRHRQGFTDAAVLVAFAVAVAQRSLRSSWPKRGCGTRWFRSTCSGPRTFRIALGTGFAFMVGYYGLPFVFSLYLQGERGLTLVRTGLVFLPMMLIGLALTPFSARIVERVGARAADRRRAAAMTVGLAVLALLPATTPLVAAVALMVLVGLGGPLTMPPMTAVLLNHVPARRTVSPAVSSTPAASSAAPWRSPSSARCWPTAPRSWTGCATAC